MTIGIGAVCHGGNLIVMAADSRGSYSDPTLPAHDQIGKQYDLPFHFCVNIAGTIATCQSVVSFLYNEMEKLKEEPEVYHDHIRIAIRNAQLGELEFLYDYALMKQLGMRRTEWFAAFPSNPRLRRAGRAVFKTIDLNVALIVGGFLKTDAVLLIAWESEPSEMATPFAVIGSGSSQATQILDRRGQNQ